MPSGSALPLLLIVSFEQFGYHIDTFEYCRHLQDKFRITYICPDQGLPRRELPGVGVVYGSRPPLGKVELGLLRDAARTISRQKPDVVFLRRTKFSFLLRLRHPRTPMIFDVRSGSVEVDPRRRRFENALLRFNSRFFRDITVISEGLKRQLRLPRRARILPLAADRQPRLSAAPRDELRLISIGTFHNRHLERTVEGVGRFLAERDSDIPLRYTIVGFGSEAEVAAIRKAAIDHGLQDAVEIRDRVDHEEVPALLAEHNIGVAFTPQVPWFEHQPSTKIYEYLHSGLLCIATDTAANRDVISNVNGVQVDGTAESFARGLDRICDLVPRSSPSAIAEGAREFTWERVVNDTLAPFMETVRR